LEDILEEAQVILQNAGIDTGVFLIPQGEAFEERVAWFEKQCQHLEEQTRGARVELKVLAENQQIREKAAVLAHPETHPQVIEELRKNVEEQKKKVEKLERQLECLFRICEHLHLLRALAKRWALTIEALSKPRRAQLQAAGGRNRPMLPKHIEQVQARLAGLFDEDSEKRTAEMRKTVKEVRRWERSSQAYLAALYEVNEAATGDLSETLEQIGQSADVVLTLLDRLSE